MTAPDSRLLQFLFDAEKPLRIADGDGRRILAQVLSDLGLVDSRKSGWWLINEAGHRFVGGSLDVSTFVYQLRQLAEKKLQLAEALPTGKRSAAEARRLRSMAKSARIALEWLSDGKA